jgi:hypothetical protein
MDSITAADRVHLLEVYARSVMLLELEDFTRWAGLFVPSVVVERVAAPHGSGDSSFQCRGRDALLALVAGGEFDVALGRSVVRYRHVVHSICLFGDAPRDVRGYAQVTLVPCGVGGGGGLDLSRGWVTGRYSDHLHKSMCGSWQFVSRSFAADG